MLHVFVETNWIVAYAAPAHRRIPAARELLARASAGQLTLHVPAFCLVEARKVIRTKFQPRSEADAIRNFVGWAAHERKLPDGDRALVLKVVDMFESHAQAELARLDQTLEQLREAPGVHVFALDERQLELSVDLGFSCDLKPYDQSVLAAILGRAAALHAAEPDAAFAFCELDGDLQPWDRHGRPKPELADRYDERGIWVYSDFDMVAPQRPEGWPSR